MAEKYRCIGCNIRIDHEGYCALCAGYLEKALPAPRLMIPFRARSKRRKSSK